MERFQRPLIISVLIAIGLYFGALFLGDFQATKDSILAIPFSAWIIILGLSIVNYILRYVRWQWYILDLSSIKIPHKLHFAYYLSGFALSTTPGKAGETIRSVYLKRHGISFNQSISAFFVERFLDLLTIVVLSVMAAYFFEEYQVFVIVTLVVIFSLLPMIHSQYLLLKAERISERIGGKVGRIVLQLVKLLESSSMLMKNRLLYGGFFIGILAWGAEGVGFWYTLHLMGQDVGLLMAISVYGIAVLVGALSFLPGGLGSTELVMGLLLVTLGVDKPTAVAATLICRIATLWFAVFIGLGVAASLTAKGHQLSLKSEEVE